MNEETLKQMRPVTLVAWASFILISIVLFVPVFPVPLFVYRMLPFILIVLLFAVPYLIFRDLMKSKSSSK